VECLTPWIYVVEEPETKRRSEVHVCRILSYKDNNVGEAVTQQSRWARDGHRVASFTQCRQDSYSGAWQLEVQWLGLTEKSFEPLTAMWEDAPTLVADFVRNNWDDLEVQRMIKSCGLPIPTPQPIVGRKKTT
jgi:hypothetical protein